MNRTAAKQRQLLLVTRTPRVQGGRKGQKVKCCLRSVDSGEICTMSMPCAMLCMVFCHTRLQYRVGNQVDKPILRSCSCSRCNAVLAVTLHDTARCQCRGRSVSVKSLPFTSHSFIRVRLVSSYVANPLCCTLHWELGSGSHRRSCSQAPGPN